MFSERKGPHNASRTKYYGKYPGVVKGNEPSGKDPHRGELLVEVPGILEQTPDDSGQKPIRVTAKPCFSPGFFFIPELEDNVWVEFAAGDINVPIWTGVWYPKDKTPKTVDAQAPTRFQKIISTFAGHEIQLDDTGGNAERIVILHKTGSAVEIAGDGKITITDTGNGTSIVSKKISLGTKDESSEPIVMGDTLKSKLEELIDIITRHVHPTGVGPSGPPATEASSLTGLRSMLSQILSTQNTTD